MYRVFTSALLARIAVAINSGPVSPRMCCGVPRIAVNGSNRGSQPRPRCGGPRRHPAPLTLGIVAPG